MQLNSSFSLRQNRFSERIEVIDKEYTCVQYKKYFTSVKNEKEMFTNFISSLASLKYIILKKIYRSFNNNEDTLGKMFQADELIYNSYKIGRLFNIIYQNTGLKLKRSDISKIYKFKYSEDDEIQIYFYFSNGILNLILVDIYHLGIVAKKDGKYRWIEKYKSKRRYKLDIANIKEQT